MKKVSTTIKHPLNDLKVIVDAGSGHTVSKKDENFKSKKMKKK